MRLSELTKSLDRSQFACGNEALDDYFHKFVGQDVRNGLAKCYVALADDSDTILGYFTLSCWALDQRLLPEDKRRGRYLHLPVALLGRLAVPTSQNFSPRKPCNSLKGGRRAIKLSAYDLSEFCY